MIVERWDSLAEPIKAAIVAMIRSSVHVNETPSGARPAAGYVDGAHGDGEDQA